MVIADDIVLTEDRLVEVNDRNKEWKGPLESKILKISRVKEWKEASYALCDKRTHISSIVQYYKILMRPAIMYETHFWVVDRKKEPRMGLSEIRILRWMSGKDNIENEYIKNIIGVASIVEKVKEKKLMNLWKRKKTVAVWKLIEIYMNYNIVNMFIITIIYSKRSHF